MPDQGDRVTAVEVEVALAALILYLVSLAAHERERKLAIGREEELVLGFKVIHGSFCVSISATSA